MDERSVCAPQLAESDAENKTISTPNAASVTDADKVINTNVNVSQIEGELDEEELLKGLLTDDYCHVCEAVLLFESQRISHYEGKKHAHKLRLYLQTKRDEKMKKNTGGFQRGLAVDKERFCELCNMVFSSSVVARSHYEGKVHAKNLRKQGLYPTHQPADVLSIKGPELHTVLELTHTSAAADLKSARDGDTEPHASAAADLKSAREGDTEPHASAAAEMKSAREGDTEPLDPAAGVSKPVTQRARLGNLKIPGVQTVLSDPKKEFDLYGKISENDLWPTATSTNTTPEVDLKDPNKYCALCVASFNNPQMALQHYNGRKHQRNQARQQLLKELGEDGLEANSLTCPICSVKFNSVEMYQAHMQGNKHQIQEQKVVNLCKSQQKVYNSFTDELADYIQVQKARGLAPKTNLGLAPDDGEEEEDEEEVDNKEDRIEPNRPRLPPTATLPLPPHPGPYCPPAGWCPPPYQGPPGPYSFRGQSHGWGPSQPLLPGTGSPQITGRPKARRRRRERSSSSSSYTSPSSSFSSYSGSTSDSSDSDYRHREKRRKTRRRIRREKGRRAREKDSDEEDRNRRRQVKRARDEGSEERKGRGEELVESEDERRRARKRRRHGKSGRREEKRTWEEEVGEDGGRKGAKEEKAEGVAENREGTEVQAQAEVSAEREQAEPSKPKHRKEKKKTKEKLDTRTEEEKLWDESILGL